MLTAEVTTTSLGTAITEGTTTFLGVCTSVINYMVENPLLVLILVGATLVPLGIGIFRKVKRAAGSR